MQSELPAQISQAVNSKKEDALAFLRELIRFQTVVGSSYQEIQETIAEKLAKMKLEVDKWYPDIEEMRKFKWWTVPEDYYPHGFQDKPVVVGTLKGKGQGRSLILNGHVEVVTPEPLNLWNYDPWAGEMEEGKLYGRGVIDCKGGLAAAIFALECLLEIGVEIKGDVIIESVYDEEIGGTGTDATILRGYKADGAIFLEPSNLCLTIAHVGVMWFRVIVEGKSAHAARVWNGVNAIEKAIKVHQALADYGDARMKEVRHPIYEGDYPVHATFNPGTFTAGGYPSSVPDKAVLEYRIGLIPGEENEKVFEEIQDVVRKVTADDEWLSNHPPKVEKYGWYGKPGIISKDHPFTQSIAKSYEEVMGRPPHFNGVTACGDVWRLEHISNCPSLTLGCTGERLHQNDEYMVVEDYFKLIRILAHSILRWCGHR